MIALNKKIILENDEILEQFCELFRGEAYNEVTRITTETLIDYICKAYECDKKLTDMVHEKIGDDVYPIVVIECHEFADINSIDFHLFSPNRDILKREELEFHEFCDICFGHLGGLLSKLQTNLDGY